MKHYIMKIINEEPLKIGATGDKSSQTESCLEYIPGSTLRGAWINKLFKANRYSENEKIQALSEIKFYNAYPCKVENGNLIQSIPVPKNLRVNKHELRKAESLESYEDEIVKLKNMLEVEKELCLSKDEKDEQEKRINSISSKFININEDKLKGIKVSKTYRFHHNTKRNQNKTEYQKNDEDRDNLFRYEALDNDQVFLSIIGVDENIDEKLKIDFKNLISKSTKINLGGSKTSGYGACSIEGFKTEDNKKELEDNKKELELIKKYLEPIKMNLDISNEYVTILALSDCILRDESGWATGDLDECLKEILGNDSEYLQLNKKIIDIGHSKGYNSKWKARLPKEALVQAGSIWKYEWNDKKSIEEGKKSEIIAKLYNSFNENLYGERQNDGFGWLMINPTMPSNLLLPGKKSKKTLNSEFKKSKEEFKEKLENNSKENSKENEIENLKKDENNQQYHNMKILLQGFSDGRKEWQQDLIYQEMIENKEKDIVIDSIRLNANRIQILIKMLKNYNESINKIFDEQIENSKLGDKSIYQFDQKTESDFKRLSYIKNKHIFSLKECNFEKCFEYLKNPGESVLELDKFVNTHLEKTQGLLYYGEFHNNIAIKKGLFLSEFLIEYFAYIKRNKEGIPNDK